MKDCQVTSNAEFKKWKAVGIGFREVWIDNGLEKLNNMMVKLDIGIQNPDTEAPIRLPYNDKAPQAQKVNEMFEKCTRDGTQFLLIVLAQRDTDLYSMIKYRGDYHYGIPNVCVVNQTKKFGSQDLNNSYFANVALKINAKMGGLNQASTMRLFTKTTMVVSIDVTHPAPGSVDKTPSIAAVVASIDDQYAQYPASIMAQGSRVERIENLARMLGERLNLYRDLNAAFPEQILLYRDGVSEGEYLNVLNYEGAAVDEAIA